jgi:hypothetical protein
MNPASLTNRHARHSLIAVILTVLTFCIGFAPIPLTAIPCYPTSVVCGVVALVTGLKALREIRASGEQGRWMALTGIILGAGTILAILVTVCLTLVAALALLPVLQDAINQLWRQVNP